MKIRKTNNINCQFNNEFVVDKHIFYEFDEIAQNCNNHFINVGY